MAKTKGYYLKNASQPDETRSFVGHGKMDLIKFPDGGTIGRAEFESGWKWSNDVKPIANTESCEAAHRGFCISGSMHIRMNNGEEFDIRPGDAFAIEPGHDAWVTGEESCVLLDFGGFENYAKPGLAGGVKKAG